MLRPLLDSKYDAKNEFTGIHRTIVPFVACGDLSGFDSDQSYPLHLHEPLAESALKQTLKDSAPSSGSAAVAGVYCAPVQRPINPPYAQALSRRSSS